MTANAAKTVAPSLVEQIPPLAPFDEHNQTLANNVHPTDWTNPAPDGRYNMVVIGAGTAGLVTAAAAAGVGGKVALIERKLMGGDCLNVGCVPSKALIRCARAAADVRRAGQYSVNVPDGDVTVDFAGIMERMRKLRAQISKVDSAKRFHNELGVDVYIGDAKFTGADRIDVGGVRLTFAKACIAAGSRAVEPDIKGLKEHGFLTNESVFSLTELPKRLAVLGGGPIGCELAQAFARFGSQVTLIERADHILVREDADAAEIIQRALEHDGVTIRCNAELSEVQGADDGKKLLIKNADGTTDEIIVDELLVGVGRQPNVEHLGLENADVRYDERKGVLVDDRLLTSNKNIYAAGDICSKYKFTHTADFMARHVVQNAFFFGRAKMSSLTIPWCTYTDPEIAHVGMYPADAKEKGIEIDTYTIELDDVDRSILESETEGFLKVHTKKGKDEIVGATLVAPHAGDMISEMTLAINRGLGLGALGSTIHPYPTVAEAMRKAGDAYSRTRLTPLVKKLFDAWLKWRR